MLWMYEPIVTVRIMMAIHLNSPRSEKAIGIAKDTFMYIGSSGGFRVNTHA